MESAGSEVDAIREFYATYGERWNRADVESMLELFAFPYVVGGGGREPRIIENAQAYGRDLQSILDDLVARGWVTSVFETVYVAEMAGETGLITAHYHRDRADGSVLESGTANYLVRKFDGRWKFVGVIAP